ncbi:hypothetical protein TB2_003799 [Malus domestica]
MKENSNPRKILKSFGLSVQIMKFHNGSTSELVTDADLKFLIDNLAEKTGENVKWENVIDKGNDILFYYAKCYKPKDGPLTYLSVTLFENCSPEKLRDFYMDKNNGVEVGRTIQKFPLLIAREYVLGWRLWEGEDKTFYCFIKVTAT